MLATRLPYRFGVTITSNWWGLLTSCMQVLSTIISVYSMLGYLAATALQAWRYRQDRQNRGTEVQQVAGRTAVGEVQDRCRADSS
jgi:hypothetical protein